MSWRRLITLMRREARATLRDPFTITVLIAVPLGAMLIFGFTLSTDVHDLALGVLDESQTAASRRLVADIESQGDFRIRPLPSRAAIEHALVGGAVSAAMIIPPTLDRTLRESTPGAAAGQIQLLYDGAETIVAGNAEGSLRGLIQSSVAAMRVEAQGVRTAVGPTSGGVDVVQ
jgi:ABC-2 type transport system permease protein